MDSLHVDILLPALAAGLIILITHVPLGMEVLKRGIIFIDLAIAQMAGLGAIAATQLHVEPGTWVIQFAAIGAALIGAALFNWIEKHYPEVEEALIGVTFILAASAGILLLAGDPHAGQQLKELLAGQILWVDWHSLIIPAVVSVCITLIWFFSAYSKPWLFHVLFAVAITVSVQLIGIYLVFASLIIPALCAIRYKGHLAMMVGLLVGLFGYIIGLIGSSVFDLPSGPMIVLSLATVALLVFVANRILQTKDAIER